MATSCIKNLEALGISNDDATALRRISMTLDRWHTLECGDENGVAVERDEETKLTYLTYDLGRNGSRVRSRCPDRESGALKRLTAIMENYPTLLHYVQSDPRGTALHILRSSDLRDGEKLDEVYTRGVAVFK